MSQENPPTTPAPPQYSQDGRWWWDGRQWISVQPQQPMQPPERVIRTYLSDREFSIRGFGLSLRMVSPDVLVREVFGIAQSLGWSESWMSPVE